MGFGSSDFQAGAAFGRSSADLAETLGAAVGAAVGRRFAQKKNASTPAYDDIDGHAGVKAEALKELARYNPAHPLLNRAYRERLFDKYATGKLAVPDMPDSQFAKDPDA